MFNFLILIQAHNFTCSTPNGNNVIQAIIQYYFPYRILASSFGLNFLHYYKACQFIIPY